jgi:hypothetical protein
MIKLLVVIVVGLICTDLYSQYYVGAGATYNVMAGESSDRNLNNIGFRAEFENRQTCWLWFGIHGEYLSLNPPDDYPLSEPYYNSLTVISPTIRFNPFNLDCKSYDFTPYIKGQLNIGVADNSDELSKIGLGTTFGIGSTYSFNLFQQCWMIDVSADWESPNNISLADGRLPVFYYQLGATLSWRIQ